MQGPLHGYTGCPRPSLHLQLQIVSEDCYLWRQQREHACTLQVGVLYPISADQMVWTVTAPIRLVKEAGVEFDPSNGGRFRSSTQAVDSQEESTATDNPLEVIFCDYWHPLQA